MQEFDRKEIYRLAAALLRAIENAQPTVLAAFGVSPAIYAEILEELDSSGEQAVDLALAPYDRAFQPDRSGRVALDLYPLDTEPSVMRVACQLWSKGRKTDLTLIADYVQGAGALTFRLLETQ
ncbi:hypothetical protein ABE458_23165 [Pseudomonas protegens]|uniref:hypothetical protein n=1 Tax=Pseudomonas TaxID=286 RepID=UPI001A90CDDD|nr:hypothetical protein [Pseudomonas protegens]BCT34342.1 hypothetical protein PproGo58_38370 [Pseudomonas protegens]